MDTARLPQVYLRCKDCVSIKYNRQSWDFWTSHGGELEKRGSLKSEWKKRVELGKLKFSQPHTTPFYPHIYNLSRLKFLLALKIPPLIV